MFHLLNPIFYLLSFEINMYNIAIISNLPIIILKERINLEIESISIVVIPTDKPLLEIVTFIINQIFVENSFSLYHQSIIENLFYK